MRITNQQPILDYKILIVDDEPGIVDSLSFVLKKNGYKVTGLTNPVDAIVLIRKEHFDLLILDFLMSPIHGDKVVESIREFNNELYILLLTGHKDLAPPFETIRALDIQGYCEKGDRIDQLLLLVESGIKSISQMRTIKKFKEGLNKILEAVPKMYQLQPIHNILEDILLEILPLVNSTNAFILVDDVTKISVGKNSIYRGIGKYKTEIEDFVSMLGPDLMENIGGSRINKKIYTSRDWAILPLINELQQDIGVIFVEVGAVNDDLKLLEIYANQAASSISNAFLHSLVNIKNDELAATYEQLRERYMDTIEALRLVVDAKDIYTRGHSERVAYYSVKIGKACGLNAEELELLRIGGLFHDVGKIGTSDDILFKSSKLDRKEYEEIKKHPIKGAHILSAISMFKDVVPLVKCHHERIDGKGYPDGLKKNEIPFLARIIAISDAFDAMLSDRHYRVKLKFEEAKNQLVQGSGTQFDAELIRIFIKVLDNFDNMVGEIAGTYL